MPALLFDRPRRTVVALLGLAALTVLASAWSLELIGGFTPCKLCLEQRWPYYLAIPLAAVVFAAEIRRAPAWVVRIGLVVLVALFAWGLSVGAYQAGAEWGWWPGPADCSATRGAEIPAAAGDLMASLGKVRIADCTKPEIRILGLSFAGWNVLISTGLVALGLAGIFARDRTTA